MTLSNPQVAGMRVPQFDLNDRLVKARETAGITQARMAELLGCSRRTIVRYESAPGVPRSVVLAYHVATQTDLVWIETGCTPSDLNREPTD
jgi:DNA-binding XRE family transcriptional regulator